MAVASDDGGEDPRWRRGNTDCVSFLSARSACAKVVFPPSAQSPSLSPPTPRLLGLTRLVGGERFPAPAMA